MAHKKFAMIDLSLLSSPEFRALDNCSDRNVYFTTYLSSQATYAGLFRLPLPIWAVEAGVDLATLEGSIERLRAANLLSYDGTSEFVRVVGWYRSSNCPKNQSHARKVAKGYLANEYPVNDLVHGSIAEFVIGCLLRVRQYSEESSHGPKVVEELRLFLTKAAHEFPNLRPFLEREFLSFGAPVTRDFETVMMGLVEAETLIQRASGRLQIHAVRTGPTPCPEGVETVSTHRDVERDVDEETKKIKKAEKNDIHSATGRTGGPRPETLNSALVRGGSVWR